MTIGIIRNEGEHAEAISQLERLMISEPEAESPDDRLMELLGHLIEEYEARSFPVEPVTHAELLAFLMDLHELSQADLAPLVGDKSRVSEVLKGVRPLSVRAMSLLKTAFHLECETIMSCRPPGAEELLPYDSAGLSPKVAELVASVIKDQWDDEIRARGSRIGPTRTRGKGRSKRQSKK